VFIEQESKLGLLSQTIQRANMNIRRRNNNSNNTKPPRRT